MTPQGCPTLDWAIELPAHRLLTLQSLAGLTVGPMAESGAETRSCSPGRLWRSDAALKATLPGDHPHQKAGRARASLSRSLAGERRSPGPWAETPRASPRDESESKVSSEDRGTIGKALPLLRRVIDQTCRRVLKEEVVPALEKITSFFEEHTDIIRKDNRDTLYGHKICLVTGGSSLVLDCIVLEGNPADVTLPETMKLSVSKGSKTSLFPSAATSPFQKWPRAAGYINDSAAFAPASRATSPS